MNNIKLNNNQKKITEAYNESLMVNSAPGTGKTFIIKECVNTLVNEVGYPADELLIMTKTNTAKDNLINQVNNHTNVNITTIEQLSIKHAKEYLFGIGFKCAHVVTEDNLICNFSKEIKKYNFPPTKLKKIVRAYNETSVINRINSNDNSVSYLTSLIIEKNKELSLLVEGSKEYKAALSELIKVLYAKFKKENELFVFDEVNEVSSYMLENGLLDDYYSRYSVLILDEVNDTNEYGIKLIKWFRCNNKVVKLFGDVCQSIMVFSGALKEEIIKLTKPDSGLMQHRLIQSYRSTKSIVNYCNILRKAIDSTEAESKTDNEAGNRPVYITYRHANAEHAGIMKQISELIASGVNPSDIAVLSNLNSNLEHIAKHARNYAIKYKIWGSENKAVSTVIAFLTYLKNQEDTSALISIASAFNLVSSCSLEVLAASADKENLTLKNYILSTEEKKHLKIKNYFEKLDEFIGDNSDAPADELIDNYLSIAGVYDYYNSPSMPFKNCQDFKTVLEKLNEIIELSNEETNTNIITEIIETLSTEFPIDNCINILSTFQSKGVEFDYVFVTGLNQGEFPCVRTNANEDIKNQLQVYYVACSRARKQLYLTNHKYGFDNKELYESQYLSIGRDLIERKGEYEFDTASSMPIDNNSNTTNSDFNSGTKVKSIAFGVGTVIDNTDTCYIIDFIDDKNKKIRKKITKNAKGLVKYSD